MAVFKNAVFYPETANFIQAVPLSETEMKAVGRLVGDLKSYNLWNKMLAIYPFVGFTGSAGFTTVVPDSFKWNLKDPRDINAAYRLTFQKVNSIGLGSNWYASSNGLKPNGYDQGAITQITASSIPVSNFHFSYYSRTNSIKGLGGAVTGGGGTAMALYPSTGSTTLNYANVSTNTTPVAASSIGLHTITAPATNTLVRYYNNTGASSTMTFQSNVNYPIGLFSTTYNGTTYGSGLSENGDAECAFASIGYALSDLDVTNLYTAVQRFQTTLGRQV
jgi:hypothetical protein